MDKQKAATDEKPRRNIVVSALSFLALSAIGQVITSPKWLPKDLYLAVVAASVLVAIALHPQRSLKLLRLALSLGPFRLPATAGFILLIVGVVLPWYRISWPGSVLEVDGLNYPPFAAGLFALGVFGTFFAAFSTRFGEALFCTVLAVPAMAISYYLVQEPRIPDASTLPLGYQQIPPSDAQLAVLYGLRLLMYGAGVALGSCSIWMISRLFHKGPEPETFPRFKQGQVWTKDDFPRFTEKFPRL